MTIATCVWVPDGIVLAADSRQTLQRADGTLRTGSDNVQKILELDKRCACLSYGLAAIGNQHAAGLIQRFRADRGDELGDSSPPELAKKLADFLQEIWQESVKDSSPPTVNFHLLVAGFGKTGVRAIEEIVIPGKSIVSRSGEEFGFLPLGSGEAIRRLLSGVDTQLTSHREFPSTLGEFVRGLEYEVKFDGMTLQDAIDYAVFVVRTTIDIQRFADGTRSGPKRPPISGGPIDVAIIRPYAGFEWVKQKRPTAPTP
jgi:hypothetical protein